jgi:hypothetical protein
MDYCALEFLDAIAHMTPSDATLVLSRAQNHAITNEISPWKIILPRRPPRALRAAGSSANRANRCQLIRADDLSAAAIKRAHGRDKQKIRFDRTQVGDDRGRGGTRESETTNQNSSAFRSRFFSSAAR